MTDSVKNILLAEDRLKDVKLILAALEDSNLANRVEVVRDGKEALDYLHRRGKFSERSPAGQPILVILDLKMPKVDGLDVLREMKSDEELKVIPVVMLTSSSVNRDLEECYKLGVNAYVVKPLDFRQFSIAVKELGLFWAVINQPPPDVARGSE